VSAIAIAVGSSLLTAFFVRSLGTFQDVQRHDRELEAINEDLRRWVRDSNSAREQILREILDRERSAPASELATTAERFREQWRNEASQAGLNMYATVQRDPAANSFEPAIALLEEGTPLRFPRRSLLRGTAIDEE